MLLTFANNITLGNEIIMFCFFFEAVFVRRGLQLKEKNAITWQEMTDNKTKSTNVIKRNVSLRAKLDWNARLCVRMYLKPKRALPSHTKSSKYLCVFSLDCWSSSGLRVRMPYALLVFGKLWHSLSFPLLFGISSFCIFCADFEENFWCDFCCRMYTVELGACGLRHTSSDCRHHAYHIGWHPWSKHAVVVRLSMHRAAPVAVWVMRTTQVL